MAEIRMLQIEEIPQAVELAQGVFGFDLRQTITDPQMIRFFEEYTTVENLTGMVSQQRLYMWGIFEAAQLCGMSAMQPEGHITMLYVYPYFRKKKYARQLLDMMRRFAKQSLGLERVTACALPAWTATYFIKNGFWQMRMQQNNTTAQTAAADGWTQQAGGGAAAQQSAGAAQNQTPGFVYVEAKTLNDVVYPVKKIPGKALAATIILTILAIIAVIAAYFGMYGVNLL